jgi:hypothetical protein
VFLEHVSDSHPWDFICLQEAFQKTEGLVSMAGHTIVTPKTVHGGLRCPAIIVRDAWSRFIKVVGSSTRWVAIEFKRKYIIVSAHLPHRRIPTHEFVETLWSCSAFCVGSLSASWL